MKTIETIVAAVCDRRKLSRLDDWRRSQTAATKLFSVLFARTFGALPCIVLSIFVVSSPLSVFAQVTQAWVAKYNNGILNGTNQAVKMVLDGAGNIYVTGFSQNATNGNLDYATIKYAPNGNQVWAARYVATNSTTAKPAGIVIDSSNNIIVTGNALTVKYDTNGNQLWTSPYAGYSIVADTSNNVFIPGSQSTFGVVKINSSGTNLWEMTHAAPQGPAIGQSVSLDFNGNSYVAGYVAFYQSDNGQGEVGPYYYLTITKYGPNGNELWFQQYSANEQLGGFAIQTATLDSTGNFYLLFNGSTETLGYSTWKVSGTNGTIIWKATDPAVYRIVNSLDFATGLAIDSFDNATVTGAYYTLANASPPSAPSYYGTFKLNPSGIYVGTNLYPVVATSNTVSTTIAVDQANNAYVTGYSPGTNMGNDIVTIKYNNNGNQIWLQRYNGPGNGDDEGNAIAVDALGNVYVTGYDTTAAGGTEMVTIKYAPVATIQKQGNGSFLLQEQAEPGEAFDFQASTNLQTWLDLGSTNADTNGLVQFLDTNATNFAQRFYLSVPQ
jgi:hypothetical protein